MGISSSGACAAFRAAILIRCATAGGAGTSCALSHIANADSETRTLAPNFTRGICAITS